MDAATLESRYFDRMAASIGDKSRILQWIRPGAVADMGAGGGELSAVIAALPHVSAVYAIDSAPDAIDRLRALQGVTAVQGSFGEVLETLPDAPLETIVCSSVLHEVCSYGGLHALPLALESCAEALKPGGHLIIRDGVQPRREWASALIATEDDTLIRKYNELCPDPRLRLQKQAGDGVWEGSQHAVAEALFTITWGADSMHREAKEQYQVASLSDYPELVTGHGFKLLHAEEYVQQGYRDALSQYKVFAADSRGRYRPWFPSTNAIWVYERL